ncbi:ShlB/FhaC/HecB family hemolysin secretion/activation protein [Sphaerotilus mobilis]|uniref:Hemolysin activation/secretion protein n=1 Tax=Sphaerotilus mobilis TaxID=47994 RepID=A0A4Q7LBC7_9BURK|nr:ShlB/FhaC/HecB family hemolysin secretion/activation protein [Sphaerotilus mobilis]RZS47376.1 hemolysin activation/secretion protein [Sphaerotilus mobilis]
MKTSRYLNIGPGAGLCTVRAVACGISGMLLLIAPEWLHAQETASDPLSFAVTEVRLEGRIDLLAEPLQAELLDVLAQARGVQVGTARLRAVAVALQQVLERSAPGQFRALIPAQALDDGALRVQVLPVLQAVEGIGADGYDAARTRAGLPSLRPGIVLPLQGDPVDPRDWALLREHPIKQAQVRYLSEIGSNRGPSAQVIAQAPAGRRAGDLRLDNSGSQSVGRWMLSAQWLDGNLTGDDDTLSLSWSQPLQHPQAVRIAGLVYGRTMPAEHLALTLGLSHADSASTTAVANAGLLVGQGRYDEASLSLAHFLATPGQRAGESLKLLGEATLGRVASQTDFLGQTVTTYRRSTAVLGTGLEWLKPGEGENLMLARGMLHGYKVGMLGTSGQAAYTATRVGAGGAVWFKGSLLARWQIGPLQLQSQTLGQYTQNKLTPTHQMQLASWTSGVRGHVDTLVSGDSALVQRTELLAAPLSGGDLLWRPYALADVGRKLGGNEELATTLASVGLGLRSFVPDGRAEIDLSLVRKVDGAERDIHLGSGETRSRDTLGVSARLRF